MIPFTRVVRTEFPIRGRVDADAQLIPAVQKWRLELPICRNHVERGCLIAAAHIIFTTGMLPKTAFSVSKLCTYIFPAMSVRNWVMFIYNVLLLLWFKDKYDAWEPNYGQVFLFVLYVMYGRTQNVAELQEGKRLSSFVPAMVLVLMEAPPAQFLLGENFHWKLFGSLYSSKQWFPLCGRDPPVSCEPITGWLQST